MNHKQYKKWIQLANYEELDADEKHELQKHLSVCDECRAEFGELKKFHSVLAQRKRIKPSQQLLSEARQRLRAALRQERSRRSFGEKVTESLSQFVLPHYKLALGGIATLAFGIFVGYLAFTPSSRLEQSLTKFTSAKESFLQGDTRITNVRFLDPDAASGEIEFTFDAVTPVRVGGNINDERVQKVLAHALLNEPNPGTRLRTVNAIAAQAQQQKLPDPEVKTALIQALKSDENPGVRKEALTVLAKFPFDKQLKDALLYVLKNDKNTGLRIAAINSLDTTRIAGREVDQEVLNVLKEKMQTDDNNYIRIRARAVVEGVKQ